MPRKPKDLDQDLEETEEDEDLLEEDDEEIEDEPEETEELDFTRSRWEEIEDEEE